jgi:hypothetical protein
MAGFPTSNSDPYAYIEYWIKTAIEVNTSSDEKFKYLNKYFNDIQGGYNYNYNKILNIFCRVLKLRFSDTKEYYKSRLKKTHRKEIYKLLISKDIYRRNQKDNKVLKSYLRDYGYFELTKSEIKFIAQTYLDVAKSEMDLSGLLEPFSPVERMTTSRTKAEPSAVLLEKTEEDDVWSSEFWNQPNAWEKPNVWERPSDALVVNDGRTHSHEDQLRKKIAEVFDFDDIRIKVLARKYYQEDILAKKVKTKVPQSQEWNDLNKRLLFLRYLYEAHYDV